MNKSNPPPSFFGYLLFKKEDCAGCNQPKTTKLKTKNTNQRRDLVPLGEGGIKGGLVLIYQFISTLTQIIPMTSSYNKRLKPLARKLRKQGTKGEAILWRDVLKARQMKGYQFNRQFIIGKYIVDFVCRELKLIIEIDGYSHFIKSEEDYIRQKDIEKLGYQFLRFSEAMVIHRIDKIVTEIDYAMECIEERLGKNDKL